jgi:hypothetical protein
MVAGRAVNKDELNNAWGGLASSMHAVMSNVLEAKAVLDGYSSADLVSLFGFTSTDADVLKSAASDMADIAGVFAGSAPARTLPYDYRVFAKRLLGTGLY